MKTAVKFRDLQINKIVSNDTNLIFPIPYEKGYLHMSYCSKLSPTPRRNKGNMIKIATQQTFFDRIKNFPQKCINASGLDVVPLFSFLLSCLSMIWLVNSHFDLQFFHPVWTWKQAGCGCSHLKTKIEPNFSGQGEVLEIRVLR